jgi:hypothetical protein
VVSVRHTSADAYSGAVSLTRSAGDSLESLPMYELTLENADQTKGFAVVADPSTVNMVMAYSPQGYINIHPKQ